MSTFPTQNLNLRLQLNFDADDSESQTKEESQLRSENHNDDNQPFQPRFEDFFVRVVQDKIKF